MACGIIRNMIILQGNALARTFGADVLFENISFSIQEKSRIALVGKNGVGKSTLLKIIVGEEEPSSGTITIQKSVTIGYLAQNTGLSSEITILKELESVFENLSLQEKELRAMEFQMAELSGQELNDLIKRYDTLNESFSRNGGYTFESDLKAMLNAFKFSEEMWDYKISDLSGGQKTRLALAKMLLMAPDILILDEPTNHLDIATLAWLENYLLNYRGAMLLVSHDRYFLDRVANEVYEMSRGHLTHYVGNYSAYVEAREAKLLTEENEYEKQKKEIAALEDFVAKNLVRASTTKRAQSRQKRLDKMQRLDAPQNTDKIVNVIFSPDKTSGNEVLKVTGAKIGYDKQVLAKNINLNLPKLGSVAIVGPNGIGKSTLLKTIIGRLELIDGEIKLGANVTIGYYDQEQVDLTASNSVLDELWNAHRTVSETEIRTILGSFLFSGEDVKKTVGMLSGGEKARLLLAKLSMQHDNFLILDEPTNHLDIESREALEEALVDYKGTLLFVSHDRYFINQVASEVLEISTNGSQLYKGNYDYYLEKKELEEAQNETIESQHKKKNDNRTEQKVEAREQRKIEREIAEIETKISMIDNRVILLHEEMLRNTDDFVELGELQKELDRLLVEKDEIEEHWLELLEV